ncbi:response regulator transcription factor [Pseudoalteromonas sp. T1lg88]|uniref:response regulator transcription factor n=1 Tax=Pseudoalteromonas sp. T1lg88 TaxID=2077104 RepID=UPI000CF5FDDD|nr:response regulator transcription factor [Pseudoalteromonas sp. T1lg88]
MSRFQVVIADDHPLFVFALEQKIKAIWSNVVIHSANSYQQLFRLLSEKEEDLDLAIVDLSMPGCVGVEGAKYITDHYPALPLIIISAHDDFQSMNECLKAGASEFVSKTEIDTDIVKLIAKYLAEDQADIEKILASHSAPASLAIFTRQQQKVMALIASGLSNKAIANQLNISEKTVRSHAYTIFKLLEVENRTQATVKYQQLINQ